MRRLDRPPAWSVSMDSRSPTQPRVPPVSRQLSFTLAPTCSTTYLCSCRLVFSLAVGSRRGDPKARLAVSHKGFLLCRHYVGVRPISAAGAFFHSDFAPHRVRYRRRRCRRLLCDEQIWVTCPSRLTKRRSARLRAVAPAAGHACPCTRSQRARLAASLSLGPLGGAMLLEP